MGHAELIQRLGGGTAVAKELARLAGGIEGKDFERLRDTVYKARINGIPWRWRNQIAAIAREQGLELPLGFLDPNRDPKSRQRAKQRKNGGRAA